MDIDSENQIEKVADNANAELVIVNNITSARNATLHRLMKSTEHGLPKTVKDDIILLSGLSLRLSEYNSRVNKRRPTNK